MTRLSPAIVCLAVVGCATVPPAPNPGYSLVDPARTDMQAYQRDYAACAALATQGDPVASGVAGAGIGALFGALVGSVIGGRDGARYGAQLGAIHGAAGGTVAGVADQQGTLRRCLVDRGYSLIR
jgi:uncharacterized protein YcfJ